MAVDSIARGMASRALTEVSGLEVDSGIPAMSTATADKYLSNDGTSAVWVDAPEADKIVPEFLITLTEDVGSGTYTADKTYNQIKAAYNTGHPLAVLIGKGKLPMINGEINGEDAGFTFGYSEVRANGDYVFTRGIHYLHTSSDDLWDDDDTIGEYLKTDGGTLSGSLYLSTDPVSDNEAVHKKYVDDRIVKVTFLPDPTAGLNPDTSTEEIRSAIIDGKTVLAVYNSNIYTLAYYDSNSIVFGGVSGSIATEIIYTENAWTVTSTTLLPLSGGKMAGNIDMDNNSITNAQKVHIDGVAPLYLGSTIEATGTSGTRLTGTTSGAAAFVKAATQAEYVPVYVGTPTENNHSANKKYVDDAIAGIQQVMAGEFSYDESTKTLIIKTN